VTVNVSVPRQQRVVNSVLWLLTAVTFAICAYYSFALVVWTPAPGFFMFNQLWKVASVSPAVAGRGLIQAGDEVLQVGDLSREVFFSNRWLVPFGNVQPGESVRLTRLRAGQVTSIDWQMPPVSRADVFARAVLTVPTFVFLLGGLIIQTLVRPRNQQWLLLVSFCYVTAVWLAFGILSSWRISGSSYGVHATSWLLVAIILDLHLTFPRSLWPRHEWLMRRVLYGAAGVAAALEFLGRLHLYAFDIGLLLAILAAALILLWHVSNKRAAGRSAASLMLVGMGLAFGPGLVLQLVPRLVWPGYTSEVSPYVSLFAIPLLPFFYTYALQKRYLYDLAFRANRALSIYLFLLLMFVGLIVATAVLESGTLEVGDNGHVITVISIGLVGILGSIFGFAPFQRVVERRLLGVPPAPNHLVAAYASRIGTCPDLRALVRLLRDELLPAILVRQSALLNRDADGAWQVLYAAGVTDPQLPTGATAATLLAEAGRYRDPVRAEGPGSAWVRLALAVQAPGQPAGLWLLGRRDPDDLYALTEIPVLQALADQLEVALLNIGQAERLHALYQADVNRTEWERSNLARELHDGPLNEFGLLAQKVEGGRLAPDFHATYAAALAELRRTVAGLRPIMLNYGLPAGLRSLVSDLREQWPNGPTLSLDAPMGPDRYPEPVETHAYRIVQQACLNALRHAGARTITVTGVFEPQHIDVTVEDDGRGFTVGADLTAWLAERHFGLAGMHERAALIGGELHITSTPGAGTRLHLVWPAASAASASVSLSAQPLAALANPGD
jgi:signal transduction histidine kinase